MKKMILAVGGAAIALATAVAGNCAWRLYQEAKDEQVYLECTENYARIRHSGTCHPCTMGTESWKSRWILKGSKREIRIFMPGLPFRGL